LVYSYIYFKEQEARPTLKQTVLCSCVKKVNNGGGGRTWGPIVAIRGFGTIYLGEMLIWPWLRCLNMIRVELIPTKKYPLGGSISVGTAGTSTGPPGNGG